MLRYSTKFIKNTRHVGVFQILEALLIPSLPFFNVIWRIIISYLVLSFVVKKVNPNRPRERHMKMRCP